MTFPDSWVGGLTRASEPSKSKSSCASSNRGSSNNSSCCDDDSASVVIVILVVVVVRAEIDATRTRFALWDGKNLPTYHKNTKRTSLFYSRTPFFTPWSHFFESRLFGVTPIRRDSRLFGEDSRLFGGIHAYSARFTPIRRLNRCDSKKNKFHAYSAKIHAYSARCCLRGLDITET